MALDFQWTAHVAQMLAKSFGLAREEVEVTGHLLDGLTPSEISAATDNSEHSVRTQIQLVLAKTGAPGPIE
ncbi:hypothetical protein QEZ52_07820 [Aliisedimentitalea scapharcae]|uniref:HTH luxR-type domain-containing protein n=1 Tax=Aliisedimentitalea scapharcae TaxID=1524259 RepID=A0ABZ2XWG2_9RHOB